MEPALLKPDGNFIATYSGAHFNLDTLDVGNIPLEDIAHALSMNCRYNGHIKNFYSVAEHCVAVSYLVPKEDALWGLMHDATEAFVPDIPRPFKPYIGGFQEVENRIMSSIILWYDLEDKEPESVRYIDHNIVREESLLLFVQPPGWVNAYHPLPKARKYINGESPARAKQMWLERFKELTR